MVLVLVRFAAKFPTLSVEVPLENRDPLLSHLSKKGERGT